MAEGQKSFWISIGAGAVLFVAVAPFAVTFWKNETNERAIVKSELAELNSKITKNNDTLAQLQKTASVEGIAKELELLNSKIKSANDALTGVQKASLDSLSGKLEQLNANVKSANDALAGLQKATALEGVVKGLGQLDAKIKNANDAIKNTNDALADIKKTTSLDGVTAALGQLDAKIKSTNDALADIKKTTSLDGVTAALGRLDAKIKSGNDALAEIQKASMSTGSTPSTKMAELENSIGDLKKRIDDDKALRGKLSADIAMLQDALKTQSASKVAAEPSPDRNDVVVFYVQTPDALQKAQAAAAIPPLTVRFEKIGSLDDNGQADMIIQKLKAITKGRTDCSVTVAGYADTLGGDKINLAISKKRAHTVAAKLQTAFAGGPVHITEAAWGERRLQDWTPNNVAHEANRRVDVSVNCKPE